MGKVYIANAVPIMPQHPIFYLAGTLHSFRPDASGLVAPPAFKVYNANRMPIMPEKKDREREKKD